ncbi:MAG: OmpH family outer membrane protein [Bacteroidetes bacterium]|nr:OmpH family outer membrane protein [Bacteroidota bacterium]
MKNISLILNGVLLVAVAILFYLQFQKPSTATPLITPPVSMQGGGIKIAYVNADTLKAKYEWMKNQEAALNQRLANAENSMQGKQEALQNDFLKLQQKAESGNFPRAELEKEAEQLEARRTKLADEAARLERQLADDQKKAINDLYGNLEQKLKELQSQIGYDYILSYSRGGQILLANDSLDITKQVLELLNAKK